MSRRAWVLFAAMAVLWGIPYFFIKIADHEVSPSVVAFARLGLGAVVLVPIAWRRGVLGSIGDRWPWAVLVGVVYLAYAFVAIPYAELFVSSSLTAIIIAGVPLMVALLSLRWERPSPVQLLGMLVGYAGVAALVGLDLGRSRGALLGGALLVSVTIVYAIGPIIIQRKLRGVDPLAGSAANLLTAAVVTAVPAAFAWPSRVPSAPVLLSLLALGLLCTALAYVIYFNLIREAGPQRATLITYINPLVALALGVAVLGERLSAVSLVGGVLVLAGSWLATRARRAPAPRAAVSGAEAA